MRWVIPNSNLSQYFGKANFLDPNPSLDPNEPDVLRVKWDEDGMGLRVGVLGYFIHKYFIKVSV